MRKRFIRSRKARYGGMTVLLTVLLIATIVLFNVLLTTLATRYSWYANMTGTSEFSVTESCYTLLGSVLEGKDADLKIIFCDTEKNIRENATSRYVFSTASSIAERFPGKIRIECHDIWLNPDSVRRYTSTLNPATGEQVETRLKSTSIILTNKEYYRVYDIAEFYVFEGGDSSKLWAYNGEKKIAAGILHAIDPESPMVCLTNNHGEIYYDYELLFLLDDAGYSIRHIDLYKEPIPEECVMLISYNPNSDLTVSDEFSSRSEIDILNQFLSVPGHSFFVFLEKGTPKLPNYETFLNEWGVETCYYTSPTGTDYRYMVQDPTQSLTSDGYTIYAQSAEEGTAAELTEGLNRSPVFKNATALRAANGFVNNGNGSYTKGNRTMYDLYRSGSSSICWANGKTVHVDPVTLFSLTEQVNAGGVSSYVGVCASADFPTEPFLQSAVHGNTDVLLHLFHQLGKTYTPEGLSIKPFESKTISTITTAQMLRWTVLLTVVPTVIITVAAVLILVRRRRA